MMRRQDVLEAKQKALITENCYILSKLLDGTDCNKLLDNGISKSLISKSTYWML